MKFIHLYPWTSSIFHHLSYIVLCNSDQLSLGRVTKNLFWNLEISFHWLGKEKPLKGSICTLHNWQSPYITLTQERYSLIGCPQSGNQIMQWNHYILHLTQERCIRLFETFRVRGEYISKNFYFCTTPKNGPAQESSCAWYPDGNIFARLQKSAFLARLKALFLHNSKGNSLNLHDII